MTSTAIACQELVELVTEYLDDTLTTARRQAVEDHLRGCGNCSAYVDQMRAIIAIQATSTTSSQPRESDLPEGMLDGLLGAFRARGASSPS